MDNECKLIQILDAVVEQINAGSWCLDATAERVPVINTQLEYPKLRVFVTGTGEVEYSRSHREERLETYGVEVAVLKRLKDICNEQVDNLLLFAQQMTDAFYVRHGQAQGRLDNTEACVVELPQVRWDKDALLENNQFAWVMQLNVQVTR